jgi:hypothetical protein
MRLKLSLYGLTRIRRPAAWFVLLFAGLTLATSGCYQRTLAPELKYDQVRVESLKNEINKLDWE